MEMKLRKKKRVEREKEDAIDSSERHRVRDTRGVCCLNRRREKEKRVEKENEEAIVSRGREREKIMTLGRVCCLSRR